MNMLIYLWNILILKCRHWCYLGITMKWKSGKHLHATYRAPNSCFDLIRSHQQYTPRPPPLEMEPTTSACRSRNSTTGPPVHATYNPCRINKSWWIARPLWSNVSWRNVCRINKSWLLHTVVVGSISSGRGHGVHCWWDPIRSKQLFSAPYVACRCLPDFLVMVIQR